MADKIVILEDSEGNNIYPISRGLATNSVDTNAIQNGAVTSAKIDWTTSAVRPSATSYAAIGGTAAYVFGDLVVVQFNFQTLQNIPPGTTILTGFPAPLAQVNVAGIVGNTPNRFILNSSGELSVASSGTQISGSQYANFSTTYLLHATYE